MLNLERLRIFKSVFRWFKFKLGPPYSRAHERSLLAIWDKVPLELLCQIWSSEKLETSLMTSYGHF